MEEFPQMIEPLDTSMPNGNRSLGSRFGSCSRNHTDNLMRKAGARDRIELARSDGTGIFKSADYQVLDMEPLQKS